ncbi:hypothetical protein BDV96DRAFT_595415 [Lophiotrema nucula]|uniref:Uncharacterized protein n=1 Tax=Lophiotrema nucula TaxID=690887 RepID=A0A6A5ZQA9_9PLEO|nr:hypothetical protein BDV96DRAFT_595415 [Lophiotrema nucula]
MKILSRFFSFCVILIALTTALPTDGTFVESLNVTGPSIATASTDFKPDNRCGWASELHSSGPPWVELYKPVDCRGVVPPLNAAIGIHGGSVAPGCMCWFYT